MRPGMTTVQYVSNKCMYCTLQVRVTLSLKVLNKPVEYLYAPRNLLCLLQTPKVLTLS